MNSESSQNMKFKAEIDIMPLPALLDPQGKAVSSTMPQMGLDEIVGVRIGKHVTMEIEAADKSVAEAKVTEACEKLLVNQIMEGFTFCVEEV
jgi:phosphoribosylformylglycinamidine synthase